VPPDTFGGLLTEASTRLPSESEANWIVAHAAHLPVGKLLTVLDTPVSNDTGDAVRRMVDRRVAGEPLQYVLGEWSFRLLDVTVDHRALIPRPETEQVVEVALEELPRLRDRPGRDPTGPLVLVDLGTGSGVIALSLALEGVTAPISAPDSPSAVPPKELDLDVWATDVSVSALELAAANRARLAECHPRAAARLTLATGSWFEALPPALLGTVDLLVSNPPYVSAAEWSALEPVVRLYEPRSALVPGDSGLEAFVLLIDEARHWLSPGASLVLEMAPHQADALRVLAHDAGYRDIDVRSDLSGRPRTLLARWPDD
jgi:release factor glutamine methyltransferase